MDTYSRENTTFTHCAALDVHFRLLLQMGVSVGVSVRAVALLLFTVYCCCRTQIIPDDLKKQMRMWDSRFRGVDLSSLVPCEFECPRSECFCLAQCGPLAIRSIMLSSLHEPWLAVLGPVPFLAPDGCVTLHYHTISLSLLFQLESLDVVFYSLITSVEPCALIINCMSYKSFLMPYLL